MTSRVGRWTCGADRARIDDVRAAIAASDRPRVRHRVSTDGRLAGDDNLSALVRQSDGTWIVASFERGG
jgi:hypothetical protein